MYAYMHVQVHVEAQDWCQASSVALPFIHRGRVSQSNPELINMVIYLSRDPSLTF